MSRNEVDPLKRPVTGKELAAVAFGLIWVGLSMFVATRNLILGLMLLGGGFALGLIDFWRGIRSKTPEQQAEFVETVEKFENNPLVRAIDVMKWLGIIYIAYLAYANYIGANAT